MTAIRFNTEEDQLIAEYFPVGGLRAVIDAFTTAIAAGRMTYKRSANSLRQRAKHLNLTYSGNPIPHAWSPIEDDLIRQHYKDGIRACVRALLVVYHAGLTTEQRSEHSVSWRIGKLNLRKRDDIATTKPESMSVQEMVDTPAEPVTAPPASHADQLENAARVFRLADDQLHTALNNRAKALAELNRLRVMTCPARFESRRVS